MKIKLVNKTILNMNTQYSSSNKERKKTQAMKKYEVLIKQHLT